MTTHQPLAFHVMSKPIGPICNLDCKYCFYLEKEKLFPSGEKWKMADDVLETYIRQYIEHQDVPEISFAWQGGEPTLLGVDYFKKVVALQQKYAGQKQISNAFQTNGVLLDDNWAAFFAENRFLVGLSIDGPRALHDTYRVDKKQNGTFDNVMRGLGFLKKHRVEFNTLTVVNRANSQKPMEVYRFLRDIGSGFMQFIALVEREPSAARLTVKGLSLAEPPTLESPSNIGQPVTEWSVRSEDYGSFLCTMFDHWVRHDVGQTFVQIFDVALSIWMGMGSPLCLFGETCGKAMAIEHNGDLYSCDHFVYPRYKLGNLMNNSLGELATSPQQTQFGLDKATTLPQYCRDCSVRFACNGECPKHRFIRTPDGEPGLNYLCSAYKRFFTHIDPYMKTMCSLLHAHRSPATIMAMLQNQEQAARWSTAGRNDPCPCGSQRKRKNCCGI